MSQFKRALFAVSQFGKAYAFSGTYHTRIVDAGEPFTGKVDLKIKAVLPTMTYHMKTDSWSLVDGFQTNNSDNSARAQKTGSQAVFFACTDKVSLRFKKASDGGSVSILVKNDITGSVTNHSIDTKVLDRLDLTMPYANHFITITTTNDSPVTVLSAQARVASLKATIRSSATYTETDPTQLEQKHEVVFPNGLEADPEGYIIAQTKNELVNQRMVSSELFLATSDSEPTSSPVVDSIIFSSGSITDYTDSGFWYCALNMNSVAEHSNKTFRRIKKITFESTQQAPHTESTNWWDDYLALRSTSKTVTASDKSVPSDSNTRSSAFWKPVTATYRTYKGLPVPRVSLGQAGNGDFTETKNLGSLLYGPFSEKSMNHAYSVVTNWTQLEQSASFPSVYNQTAITMQVWNTANISDYYPVYEIALSGNNNPHQIIMRLSELHPEIYLRFVFSNTTNTQTPVLDFSRISAKLHFMRRLSYKGKLSGLDNHEPQKLLSKQPVGTKFQQKVLRTTFGFPSLVTQPAYRLEYTPKYPNQMNLYFGTTTGEQLQNEQLTQSTELSVFSRTVPEEPKLSTQEIASNKLYWHYQYDGGSVFYPSTATREVGTNFTPNLVQNKKYQFHLSSGWADEVFTLPTRMTWEQVRDVLGRNMDSLKGKNPNVLIYNGFIPEGTRISLPNDTKNPLVSIRFSNGTRLTNQSLWNGNSKNDNVLASVEGESFQAVDWTSEEHFFVGILNPNNSDKSYVRTQNLLEGTSESRRIQNTDMVAKSYKTLSEQFEVPLEDLLLANNKLQYFANLEHEEAFVKPGESYVLPGKTSLPEIPPEVWYEGTNPYRVEVLPNTVRRTDDYLLLSDKTIVPGSDDEPAISFTTKESLEKTQVLTRGSFANGKDSLSYANVLRIVRIVRDRDGTTYTPYSKNGSSEMGDFKHTPGTGIIDWSPSFSGSREPQAGETYTVTFTQGIVDSLKIIYSSPYKEKASFDKLWRSKETKLINATIGPDQELLLPLPSTESYSDAVNGLKNVSHVVEDDDLWVQSSVVKTDSGEKLLLTMGGKDPKRNWHPTIETGFYYLNNDEYYLYSEPIVHTFAEEDIPLLNGIQYEEKGLKLQ